jgi:hypothetical protein
MYAPLMADSHSFPRKNLDSNAKLQKWHKSGKMSAPDFLGEGSPTLRLCIVDGVHPMSRTRIYFVPFALVALSYLIAVIPAHASIAPLPLLNDGTDVITPSTAPSFSIRISPPNSPGIDVVSGWIDLAVTELYKSNVDDGEESISFLDSYEASFYNTPDDPADALLNYVAGDMFESANLFALLKDGQQPVGSPNIYIFNISDWNRTSDLSFEGFWPSTGAISHLTIYGAPGTTDDSPSVPEPLSFLIWAAIFISGGYVSQRTR